MYNLIRQIHLYAAFILMAFVLMYFISGFVMIFERSFERKDRSVETIVQKIDGISDVNRDSLISLITQHITVAGQYQINRNAERTVINFRHPGTESQVRIDHATDSVTAVIRKKNFVGALHHFHRIHGYHGGMNYMVWALVYDLSALSMIVFALSGVYLWYKTERTKWPGWLILILSTVFVFYTVYYLNVLN